MKRFVLMATAASGQTVEYSSDYIVDMIGQSDALRRSGYTTRLFRTELVEISEDLNPTVRAPRSTPEKPSLQEATHGEYPSPQLAAQHPHLRKEYEGDPR